MTWVKIIIKWNEYLFDEADDRPNNAEQNLMIAQDRNLHKEHKEKDELALQSKVNGKWMPCFEWGFKW